MPVIDLSKIIKEYRNKWVALTPDNKKFVASAVSLSQVLSIADKKGVKNPSVFKAPNIRNFFIG